MTGDKACAVICTVTLEGVNIKEITQRAKTHALADDKINLTNIFPTLYKISSQIVQVNNKLVSYSESANTKFSKIDEALVNLKNEIETTNERVEEKYKNIQTAISSIDTNLSNLDARVANLETRVSALEAKNV